MSEDMDKGSPQPSFEVIVSDAVGSMLEDDRVVQAFVMIMTKDDEVVRTKGHFYDNAAILNGILSDFREKIYVDIFSGPKPKM